MKKSIFISHATKDKDLVSAFVEFIESGMGVQEKDIFCSSLEGHGIPSGENFISFIKDQIQTPKIVILLLTPSYFKSNFCLCEMGAAWAMSHKIFPIIVSPLTYADVKDVLTATQVAKIEDDIKYNELRDYLSGELELNKTSNTKWDTKRSAFINKLPALLEKLSIPKDVSVSEHEALKSKLKAAEAELLEYEAENKKLTEYSKTLEKTKDKKEVAKVKKEFAEDDSAKAVEEILNEIQSMKSSLGGSEVLRFALSDYYDKPYRINHMEFGERFSSAARSNLVVLDDGEHPNWTNAKLKKLHQLLDSLGNLLEHDEDGNLQEYFSQEHAMDFEPDNQDFWEYHYSL